MTAEHRVYAHTGQELYFQPFGHNGGDNMSQGSRRAQDATIEAIRDVLQTVLICEVLALFRQTHTCRVPAPRLHSTDTRLRIP